ncbi:MAG: tripartite tricarboxylate transporter substrate binding protein [Pseudolabrys sp.]|nr:tripartite tricarboxylate transporter substrate binding protein [Pseudolabrys sp.]MSP32568.1 tripartite tricarboxylate transporter substrate binding protein [Pseudolabrys sp.]
MKITRRTLVLGAMTAPMTIPFAVQAQTPPQAWPPSNIRIVVAYPPGGSTDAMMRLIQPALQQRLGTTIVIENRSGASGSVGTGAVAKSPPDGNSWLAVFDNHAANPFVLPSLPYDTEKDLDPVLLIGTAPYLITTAKAKPYNTLADVIAAAKAKPGSISYASVGSGSVGHLAMALLSQRAGVKLTHVPYRGGGPAMNDAVAGHVDLLIGSTALSMPQVGAGTIRAVVQTGKTRNAFLTTVPTVAESGFPDFEANAWWGIFAPAGTPKPIVERFSNEMAACLREERVAKQLTETQQVSLTLGGPEILRKFVDNQMSVWGKVVKDNNIKADQN